MGGEAIPSGSNVVPFRVCRFPAYGVQYTGQDGATCKPLGTPTSIKISGIVEASARDSLGTLGVSAFSLLTFRRQPVMRLRQFAFVVLEGSLTAWYPKLQTLTSQSYKLKVASLFERCRPNLVKLATNSRARFLPSTAHMPFKLHLLHLHPRSVQPCQPVTR